MANSSVCLESSLTLRHTKPGTICDPCDTPSTLHMLPHPKSEIAAERERETKMLQGSKRPVALCATLPSGTGATVHGVGRQSLSNIGHPSNPFQWQKGGLAATHVTNIRDVSAPRCQSVNAPVNVKSRFVV